MPYLEQKNTEFHFFLQEKFLGTRERAQLVKCWPCKREVVSLIPRIHTETLGVRVHVCKPTLGKGGVVSKEIGIKEIA